MLVLRKLSLLLPFFLSACGYVGQGTGGATLAGAQSQAISWLTAAEVSPDIGNYRNTTVQVSNILLDTPFVNELDSEGGPCSDVLDGDQRTLAYVTTPATQSDIYICEAAYDFTNEVLAQVIIHEAIHITGVTDECLTSHIEVSIVSYAGGMPFKNGYIDSQSCQNEYDFSDFTFKVLENGLHGPSGINWSPFVLDPIYVY